MGFGLLKRSTSSSATTTSQHHNHHHEIKPSHPPKTPNHDVTECTTDRDDDDSSIVETPTSATMMELQHDLKAKTAQVSVLRDTLTNLSLQFRKQTKSLEDSKETIQDREFQISRLDSTIHQLKAKALQQQRRAATDQVEWREKYNDLERILARAIEERDQWKVRFEELKFDQEEEDDILLGQKNIATPQRNSLWSDDEQKQVQDTDSIWDEPHDQALLDTAIRPPVFTNRPRRFRRKKQRPAVKPFQTKPMEWVSTTSSGSDHIEVVSDNDSYLPFGDHDETSQAGVSQAVSEISRAVSDTASRAVSVRSNAKARARRVRKTAKQLSFRAGFDCQKLEC